MSKVPPPPAHLSPRAADLWRALVPRRARSPERLTMLTFALEALDRADLARAEIARDGLVATSKRSKLARVHPAVRIEAQARAEFTRLWRALHLTWDAEIDGALQ